ncbi:DoxX family protein [Emticicia sp. 21SJ11W-3]|uniref:DoxX family protein n=1 Tax=Emticicia sp. 21SJ11W-3 TaxID=2916755 RepID=UPI00209F9399|nr:DoxX family protein [Emticicia sp. 21SJ11W-3]UTA66884.1 DoxX family protein [Emticicia sp. 21SJ11W-3]
MKTQKIISLGLRIIAAVIFIQTLYFKFTAHPESVVLFSKLGAEPWGRIGTGVLELVTAVLLLLPATAFVGGLLAMGLMLGAIAAHLMVIGIESMGDGGQLFILAIVVLFCSVVIQVIHRQQGLALARKFFPNAFR